MGTRKREYVPSYVARDRIRRHVWIVAGDDRTTLPWPGLLIQWERREDGWWGGGSCSCPTRHRWASWPRPGCRRSRSGRHPTPIDRNPASVTGSAARFGRVGHDNYWQSFDT